MAFTHRIVHYRPISILWLGYCPHALSAVVPSVSRASLLLPHSCSTINRSTSGSRLRRRDPAPSRESCPIARATPREILRSFSAASSAASSIALIRGPLATARGTAPDVFRTDTLARASRSTRVTATLPFSAASCKGVRPIASPTSLCAPSSRRIRTTASWPLPAAPCSGVLPAPFLTSRPAPLSSNTRTSATCPFIEAL